MKRSVDSKPIASTSSFRAVNAGSGSTVLKEGDAADEMEVIMLGAGQEVGRSCCVIKYKGVTLVCDAGVHPAYSGMPALPFIDELDWDTVDAILVTHFHLDHAAGLPYIMEKTNFKDGGGRVYMTHATKDVYELLMQDFVRISIIEGTDTSQRIMDAENLEASLETIQGIRFYEEVTIPISSKRSTTSVRFTSYPAGHVLGASMFLIEIGGARVLYTGDYSTEADMHLIPASVPTWGGKRPDVMICESTFGVQSFEPKAIREAQFTNKIKTILKRGGKVLLPAFSSGVSQELLLVLDDFWEKNPDLHEFPIYYVTSLASRVLKVYRQHISSQSQKIQQRAASGDNPYDFGKGRFVKELRSIRRGVADKSPCVVVATPGMLQPGTSRELLERWAGDRRNGLILCGYSVEGSLARDLQAEPDEFMSVEGRRIPRRISVDVISFAQHVDFSQNASFIDAVRPANLILVHGEARNVTTLQAALQKIYADKKDEMKVYAPRNLQPIKIRIARNQVARAVGGLAKEHLPDGAPVGGLLFVKDAQYTLLDPKDLKEFTGLSTSTIAQKQRIQLDVGWDLIHWHLEGMYGSVETGVDPDGLATFRVMKSVDLKHVQKNEYCLEWGSGVTNDMVADSLLALLLGISKSPASVKVSHKEHRHEHAEADPSSLDEQGLPPRLARLIAFLDTHFGGIELLTASQAAEAHRAKLEAQQTKLDALSVGDVKPDLTAQARMHADSRAIDQPAIKVETDAGSTADVTSAHPVRDELDEEPDAPVLRVRLDDHIADVNLLTMRVDCDYPAFQKRVENVVSLAVQLVTPLSEARSVRKNVLGGHTRLDKLSRPSYIVSETALPTGTTTASGVAQSNPLLAFEPPFVYSLPIQLLVAGCTLTLLTVLMCHLLFTVRYHLPLNRLNYALQLQATAISIIANSVYIGLVMGELRGRSRQWPYMFEYVEIFVPDVHWSNARKAAWQALVAITTLSAHATHIQFLTLLFPSRLEFKLIVLFLGPLALAAAGLAFTMLISSDQYSDLGEAMQAVCNSTLTLLYTIALLIWGLFINRKRAWRTEGGTAGFGAVSVTLALIGTAVNFVEVKEDALLWLPQVVVCILLWQSWVSFWWWVGAGMYAGEVADREQRKQRRERRKARREQKLHDRDESTPLTTRLGRAISAQTDHATSRLRLRRFRTADSMRPATIVAEPGPSIELQDLAQPGLPDESGESSGSNPSTSVHPVVAFITRPKIIASTLNRLRSAHETAAKDRALQTTPHQSVGLRGVITRGLADMHGTRVDTHQSTGQDTLQDFPTATTSAIRQEELAAVMSLTPDDTNGNQSDWEDLQPTSPLNAEIGRVDRRADPHYVVHRPSADVTTGWAWLGPLRSWRLKDRTVYS
ncbi:uncharacterized protein L969DRAFT_52194 [Mixia osmundae IAM 14324]|uniref:Metallo-beta-lactamase domain-containing protein n=1 Tax=Mixia osmundae (strain CBS 9802 / IAM 14324 / JCM 22182 / KY 12970) TaxID=764103 RepID=G7DSE7_MIXOS|nr:uncharacterized protein L969DRAFT_52194 [Mixia osmundae IAM 14324]KEI37998.1 hypothetical protein L969DRAFT_52194 [Mixia osmundae IAM 14324]GAA93507.1 hypothetical protein E5Q_00148 [Mixia osmundae IAM 14324]